MCLGLWGKGKERKGKERKGGGGGLKGHEIGKFDHSSPAQDKWTNDGRCVLSTDGYDVENRVS